MISESFAVVEPIDKNKHRRRSRLWEQLALEAVMESSFVNTYPGNMMRSWSAFYIASKTMRAHYGRWQSDSWFG